MAKAKGTLKLLNDTIEIPIEQDFNGAVGVQYGTYGGDNATASTGTFILEATVSEGTWYPLKITKNDKTDVDFLAAPGMGYAELAGYTKARIRMTVVGGAQGVNVFVNARAG